MSLDNMEKSSLLVCFSIYALKHFKISRIQKEFLPKHLGRNDTVWLPLTPAHCGREGTVERLGMKTEAAGRGRDILFRTVGPCPWPPSSHNREKINTVRKGLEAVIGFLRKLVHGFSSASSCCERKTVGMPAPDPA